MGDDFINCSVKLCVSGFVQLKLLTGILRSQNGRHCDDRDEHTRQQIKAYTQPTIGRHHHEKSLSVLVLIPRKTVTIAKKLETRVIRNQ